MIVDDSAVFVHAACLLLEHEGITIIGVASTTEEAMRRFQELAPDLTLVDVELGDESGFDLPKKLTAPGSQTRLFLVAPRSAEQCLHLIAASPAAGFICKTDLTVD